MRATGCKLVSGATEVRHSELGRHSAQLFCNKGSRRLIQRCLPLSICTPGAPCILDQVRGSIRFNGCSIDSHSFRSGSTHSAFDWHGLFLRIIIPTVATSAVKFVHHFDQPATWEGVPRCLLVRGWCFGPEGKIIQAIRLRSANLTFVGVVSLPRRDVKTALPETPNDNTGFEIRGVLPSGDLDLTIEAQLADGSWHPLLSRTVRVRRQWLPLWLRSGEWTELMLSQVPCHMQHPPRALKVEEFPVATHMQPHWPKLSIVTPSFQQARFLPGTLRSVLEQAEINYEYVVQDGASTDGSSEIIRRIAHERGTRSEEDGSRKTAIPSTLATLIPERPYPNPLPSAATQARPMVWASEPDAGQADAIARGFAKTSGGPDDLMAWINSDDFYLPGTFAFVADFFARHPEVDAIYGNRILVDESSHEIGRWFLPEHDHEILRLYDFVPQETLFWRRRIWDKVGGLDTSYKFAMDWDLLLRFQAGGARIVHLPRFFACFRIHPAQKTAAAMRATGQKEIDELRHRANGRIIPPAELENDRRLIRYLRRSAFIEFCWKFGLRLS